MDRLDLWVRSAQWSLEHRWAPQDLLHRWARLADRLGLLHQLDRMRSLETHAARLRLFVRLRQWRRVHPSVRSRPAYPAGRWDRVIQTDLLRRLHRRVLWVLLSRAAR